MWRRLGLGAYPVAIVGLTSAALIAIRSGRDAAYFSPTGLERLPILYMATQIGLTIAAGVHVAAMRRWGTRRARIGAFLVVATAFAACLPLVGPEHPFFMAALFPLVPLAFQGLFASGWLLVGDLLDDADPAVVRRSYIAVGAAGTAGGTIGGLMARAAGEVGGPWTAVLTGSILLFVAAAIVRRAHRVHPAAVPAPAEITPTEPKPAWRPTGDPSTRTAALIAALMTVSGLLVELQFYAAATSHGNVSTGFFANWYAITGLLSLALQLLVAPLVMGRFGIAGALMFLPGTILLGGSALLVVAFAAVPAMFRTAEASVRSSLHQSSWEQVFLAFDRERRGQMKLLIDGVVARAAAFFAALALYALVVWYGARALGSVVWLGVVLALLGGAWLLATLRLKRLGCTDPAEQDIAIRLAEA